MNTLSKSIAASLLVMAVVASGYSVYFSTEYNASVSALADFMAYADFDPTEVHHNKYGYYIEANITLDNPSSIDITIYELNMALFLMNCTTGDFERIGLPVLFYSQYYPIVAKAGVKSNVIFYLYIDDIGDYMWNLNYSKEHGLHFRVDPYMELMYKISGYDFTKKYAWGIWHWSCEECGRGPFD